MIKINFTPQFLKDVKKLQKKHYDINSLREIVELVRVDNKESIGILRQKHNLHMLKGSWKGRYECHVVKIGDWIVIWRRVSQIAVFERTGLHDDLFR